MLPKKRGKEDAAHEGTTEPNRRPKAQTTSISDTMWTSKCNSEGSTYRNVSGGSFTKIIYKRLTHTFTPRGRGLIPNNLGIGVTGGIRLSSPLTERRVW